VVLFFTPPNSRGPISPPRPFFVGWRTRKGGPSFGGERIPLWQLFAPFPTPPSLMKVLGPLSTQSFLCPIWDGASRLTCGGSYPHTFYPDSLPLPGGGVSPKKHVFWFVTNPFFFGSGCPTIFFGLFAGSFFLGCPLSLRGQQGGNLLAKMGSVWATFATIPFLRRTRLLVGGQFFQGVGCLFFVFPCYAGLFSFSRNNCFQGSVFPPFWVSFFWFSPKSKRFCLPPTG